MAELLLTSDMTVVQMPDGEPIPMCGHRFSGKKIGMTPANTTDANSEDFLTGRTAPVAFGCDLAVHSFSMRIDSDKSC